ncbi:MAG: hypothetical protein QOG13_1149 [Sphingomonadales bacterium]|jgi:hypothetical protein|nr:hypothetical protein [Sphingomonadales bacterium]MEA3045632.1 hypothetical protein [Sphingomonadales bacterium]
MILDAQTGGVMARTTQQHNEQIRTVISLLSNGGLALFGAFAAVIYSGGGDDAALAMAFVGIALILGSFLAALFLREEA